ncbi:MAG TPA: hypothetical protein VGF35_02935 [Steroidobacteraceae bacterium]|jgi:hypothetical protein
MSGSRFADSLAQFLWLAGICALSGCQSNGGKLNEPATLHTGEVVEVLTRADILASRGIHQSLANAGVADPAIADGSVVVVRTVCCGPPSTANPHGALNAQGLRIQVGDIVEFLWPGGSAVNSVTRVLQPAGTQDGACWWDPQDDKRWRSVMFCSWMPDQGWVKQEGLTTGWYHKAEAP